MNEPLKVEIFSLVPTSYSQWKHCETFYDQSGIGPQVHNQIMREYPGELLEDHVRLSALVNDLVERYKNQLVIYVIDPQSGMGLYKSLRYWVRKYPTFMVDEEEKITGWNEEKLQEAIQRRLAS